MPLCAPRKVPLQGEDWVPVRADAGFILQKRPVNGRNKKESFRVLLRCNKFLVGEFFEEKEALRIWDSLHETEEEFDTSGALAVQQMLSAKMSSMNSNAVSSEEEFQEQSNLMASTMTIVEIVKTLPDRAELADLKDAASLVGLLTTLSRQLSITAKQILDRRIYGKYLSHLIHASMLDNWVSLPDGSSKDSPMLTNVVENTLAGQPAATSGAAPILVSQERETVVGLVDTVNKLFELSSKQFSSIQSLLKEIDTLIQSPDSALASSEVFDSSVYYIPVVDSTNKAADAKWLLELTEERKSGSAISERVEVVLIILFCSADSNPIGRAISSAVAKYTSFLSIVWATRDQMSEELLSTKMQMLRSDIYQFSDLLCLGIKLSFPGAHDSEKIFSPMKRAIRDIIILLLHTPIIQLYRAKLVQKDDAMKSQCLMLRSAPPDLSGVDPKFVPAVTAFGALQAADEACCALSETSSVREKLNHLERLSTSLFSLAAVALKKAALEKKKMNGSGGDLSESATISTVDDVMKYSIGADDFLPLLTYTLIQLNVPNFFSDLMFMADFLDDSMLLGKAGYLLASAQTSMQYIVSIHYDPEAEKRKSRMAEASAASTSTAPSDEAQSSPSTADAKQDKDKDSPARKSSIFKKRSSSKRKTEKIDIKNSGSLSSTSPERSGTPTPPSPASSQLSSSPSTPQQNPLSASQTTVKAEASQDPVEDDSWILNSFSQYQGEALEGDTAYHFSQRLYSLIISVFHRFRGSLNAPVDPNTKKTALETARVEMRADDIFSIFRSETTKLQTVSVETLPEKEKMVFFLNVYHALLLHGCIEKEWPDSDLGRMRLQQRLAYSIRRDIGGVECSLLEIEHGILRHKTNPPDTFGVSLFVKRWKNSDWNKKHFSIESAEPLLSFLISTVAASGPALRVYHADPSLEQTIAYATAAYLEREITVDEEKGEVFLPRVLEWYKKDFGRNNLEVLQWVAKWLPKPFGEKFNAYAAKKKMNNLKIKFKPYVWDFRFDFQAPPDDATLAANLPVCWPSNATTPGTKAAK